MLKSTDSVTCARCGSPFPAGQAVTDVFLLPGEKPPADHIYCSLRCRDQAVAAWLALPVCAHCGDRFAPTSGPDRAGRPAAYCGQACRKAHERQLDRAMKALARDTFPPDDRLDEIEAALADAETLGRAWSGDGPALLEPPSPRARNALLSRVDRLQRMRGRARDMAGRQAAANAAADAQRRWAAEQAAAEGTDADWRRQLLAGPGGG